MVAALLLALAQQPKTLTLNVEGAKRTALMFAPSAPARGKAPLVIALHGYTGNSDFTSKQFEVQKYWPQAYVLYPQGLPTKLFPNQKQEFPGWQLMPGQNGDRDIKFVKAMLEWAAKEPTIDVSKIHYEGHSNGSGFAWVVLKALGSKFASFAGYCGGTLLPLAGAPKKPAILFCGTTDRLVSARSVKQFAERLAKHNGCGAARIDDNITTYPGSFPVIVIEYSGGHMPPKTMFEKGVNFFKTGKP